MTAGQWPLLCSNYMMTLETTQTVPLETWDDGTIRVGGTRLLIDMVVEAHNMGRCPEEIFESFPSKYYTVADIYSVIAYYLSHKAAIDKHLADKAAKSEVIRRKYENKPEHIAFMAELRRRKAEYLRKNGSNSSE